MAKKSPALNPSAEKSLRKPAKDVPKRPSRKPASKPAVSQEAQEYRLLFERNPHPMLIYDPQSMKVLEVNEAAISHYGYSRAEFLTMTIKDIRPPDDVPELLKLLEKNKKSKKEIIHSGIWRHIKKDGTIINVEVTRSEIWFTGKKAVLVLANDVTARLKMERELQEQKEQYQRLIESVPNGIYRSTAQGKFLMVNSALVEMLGYDSHEELMNVDIPRDLYFSIEERTAAKSHVLMGKKDPNIFRLKTKSGGEIWVEESGRVEYDETGKPLYYEGVLRDITKRRQTEEALQHSEQRYRDLFDNAPDIYIILDPKGRIIDFNQRGLKKLGYTRKQIIGKMSLEIVHPDDHEKAKEMIKEIQQKQRPPKSIEIRLLTRGGEILWVNNEFTLVKSPRGELQAIRVVSRDVTERKQLEDVLMRSQRLETAGRVAGQIAHDFNNLLTPLTAYPTLIFQDLPKEHPVSGMVLEMQAAAHKIAEINQQLLALGRRGHYSFEAIDLNELVERTLHAISMPKEIVVEKHLSDDLLPIKGGAAQLTRALSNLIINAKEAMQDIGVLSIISENIYLDEPLKGYQTIERGEYVRLSISDNGPGIHPEILDRIFEPFFSTKKMDRMRGSGLGLSVVHGIMEDHKGYITVNTELGRGATFSLYFPTARDVVFKEPEQPPRSYNGNETILVVDDDPMQRRVIEQILKRLGYRVTTLTSGEEAVAHVRQHPHQLLIVDMVMDGIDGVEAYRQILEFQPQQKAIILSGYAMTQRVQEALELGAGTFLPKPVIFHQLASAVRQELDKI